MKRRVMPISILLLFLLALSPQYSFARDTERMNDGTERRESTTEEHDAKAGAGLSLLFNRVTIGCASGFLIGSAVPGIGNIIGCVGGGFIGWVSKPASDASR